jgi:hypothetical protein
MENPPTPLGGGFQPMSFGEKYEKVEEKKGGNMKEKGEKTETERPWGQNVLKQNN